MESCFKPLLFLYVVPSIPFLCGVEYISSSQNKGAIMNSTQQECLALLHLQKIEWLVLETGLHVSLLLRISRARWFNILRRVFHYQNQNGSRSNLGSNPFNSSTWMMLEFIALIIQNNHYNLQH